VSTVPKEGLGAELFPSCCRDISKLLFQGVALPYQTHEHCEFFRLPKPTTVFIMPFILPCCLFIRGIFNTDMFMWVGLCEDNVDMFMLVGLCCLLVCSIGLVVIMVH
jgi:hypothetical protein